METTNTLRSFRAPASYKEQSSAKSFDKPMLERKIRKLERICQRLEHCPAIAAGVSSEELIEILRTEEKRLKAIA